MTCATHTTHNGHICQGLLQTNASTHVLTGLKACLKQWVRWKLCHLGFRLCVCVCVCYGEWEVKSKWIKEIWVVDNYSPITMMNSECLTLPNKAFNNYWPKK